MSAKKEYNESNTLVPLYDNEDAVCGIVYNDIPYYFLKNLQGDIVAITDSTAIVIARYTYDAWGVPTIAQDTTTVGIATINPFRYRSYYYDTEIGMYYLQSRYYDPTVGRFVNGDSAEIAVAEQEILIHNLFAYCGNDSVDYIDEDGIRRIRRFPKSSKFFGTMITISQFKEESEWIVRNLKSIRVSMKLVVVGGDAQSLINAWNNLTQTKVVIINCHASPKNMNGVTGANEKQLVRKPVSLLITLGCNAGHYDYKMSNIAYTFYKKIAGIGRMLCSDGTVYSKSSFNLFSKFTSKADVIWQSYSKREDNYGWMLYGDGRRGVSIEPSSFGKQIKLTSVVKKLLFL